MMNLVDRLYNNFLVPGFLINSLPKSGTNLLKKAVDLFPGIRSSSLHIGQSTIAQFKHTADLETVNIPIGVDYPHLVTISSIEKYLNKLRSKRGYYATAHIPFSEALASLLSEMGMKSLLILRDPRDVVISHANYVTGNPKHFIFEFYQQLSESERIMKSITGIKKTTPDDPILLNIYERYCSVLLWNSQFFNYTTYFEKLIGVQGKGLRETQIQELNNIANHLGIKYTSQDINQIADSLFGGTNTFQKGLIGNWRKHFSAEHKSAFKELAGEILIDLGYEKNYDW